MWGRRARTGDKRLAGPPPPTGPLTWGSAQRALPGAAHAQPQVAVAPELHAQAPVAQLVLAQLEQVVDPVRVGAELELRPDLVVAEVVHGHHRAALPVDPLGEQRRGRGLDQRRGPPT